jgi:hypothetical protein
MKQHGPSCVGDPSSCFLLWIQELFEFPSHMWYEFFLLQCSAALFLIPTFFGPEFPTVKCKPSCVACKVDVIIK